MQTSFIPLHVVKDSDYVCGSCGTPLSTPRVCGVDNEVPQLPQT